MRSFLGVGVEEQLERKNERIAKLTAEVERLTEIEKAVSGYFYGGPWTREQYREFLYKALEGD